MGQSKDGVWVATDVRKDGIPVIAETWLASKITNHLQVCYFSFQLGGFLEDGERGLF